MKNRSLIFAILMLGITFLLLTFMEKPKQGDITPASSAASLPAGDGYMLQMKWGGRGTEKGQFYHPFELTVDLKDKIYITDSTNNRIQVFDSNGKFIESVEAVYELNDKNLQKLKEKLGADKIKSLEAFKNSKFSEGEFIYNIEKLKFSPEDVKLIMNTSKLTLSATKTNEGEFSTPIDMAVDGEGYMYVVDWGNERIQKLNKFGTFVKKWGSHGSSDGQFNHPWGIAIDKKGNIYISDTCNHRIQKFDSEGNFIVKWGQEGTGDGQLSYPNGIAIGNSGNIYVADSGNQRMQKFDDKGNFIAKWGSKGTGDGQFFDPYGVAVDSSENIYVVEFVNHRVQKFDSTGKFISKIVWPFKGPTGVAVDSLNNIYVSDRLGNNILKFTSSQAVK